MRSFVVTLQDVYRFAGVNNLPAAGNRQRTQKIKTNFSTPRRRDTASLGTAAIIISHLD
jgi:hypothetical protein